MIGRTLSHYEVLDEISRGGMGIVYRARDTKLHREVALKVLPKELVSGESQRSRFFQEARAAAALKHPHIGVIHEIDEADGVTFMALELIDGEKLSDAMARERLPVKRALELALEVAEGLSSAHAKGIVHRDLKPANVMLTEEGHAKIIDFGLAKLLAPPIEDDDDDEGETIERRETDPGVVMGTIAYMSPEQARGRQVDHRTDVFSFGIMLHEMLSGRLPFRGESSVETLNAIIKEPPAPLTLEAGTLGDPQKSELARIVTKCLAKDPAERFQSMKDLAIDLKTARRATDSDVSVQIPPQPTSFRKWPLAIAAVVLAAAIAFVALDKEPSSESDTASGTAAPARPGVAVMLFENQSGDPELDWLRTALTDMLVTDMSQSPNMNVLGTDRLYQILEDLNQLDERVTTFTVVEEIADRADVDRVVLGSFIKAGDTIRISVRVQDAGSGEILSSEQVEGVGDASIFPMVDDLTRRIKVSFEIPESADLDHDRGLADVSTSSPEAYRYYAEGLTEHYKGRFSDAVPLYEKAVAADPTFALAIARLGVVHRNLGHDADARHYKSLAMEHADRLPANQRYYVEGVYYEDSLETAPQAIAAYSKALELYPDQTAARNNLALTYYSLGRFDESLEHYERLVADGNMFPGSFIVSSFIYTARGEREKSLRALEDFARIAPGNRNAAGALVGHYLDWGELDEAERVLKEIGASAEANHRFDGWRELEILRERWDDAAADAARRAEADDPALRSVSFYRWAIVELYRGKLADALQHIERAIRADPGPGTRAARWRAERAHVLLETGEPTRALSDALLAQRSDPGGIGEHEGLERAGEAQAALGQWDDAAATAARLREKAEPLDSPRELSRYHELQGRISLARGDHAGAIEALTTAESLLPERGGPDWRQVSVWYALGTAYLAAGNEDEAATRFQRIVDAGNDRVNWPILYVRSFYHLGAIHEHRGEMDEARKYYQRFVDHWGDGEIDRDRVAEARSKL